MRLSASLEMEVRMTRASCPPGHRRCRRHHHHHRHPSNGIKYKTDRECDKNPLIRLPALPSLWNCWMVSYPRWTIRVYRRHRTSGEIYGCWFSRDNDDTHRINSLSFPFEIARGRFLVYDWRFAPLAGLLFMSQWCPVMRRRYSWLVHSIWWGHDLLSGHLSKCRRYGGPDHRLMNKPTSPTYLFLLFLFLSLTLQLGLCVRLGTFLFEVSSFVN